MLDEAALRAEAKRQGKQFYGPHDVSNAAEVFKNGTDADKAVMTHQMVENADYWSRKGNDYGPVLIAVAFYVAVAAVVIFKIIPAFF